MSTSHGSARVRKELADFQVTLRGREETTHVEYHDFRQNVSCCDFPHSATS